MATERVFDLNGIWQCIEALDGKIASRVQLDLQLAVQRHLHEQIAEMIADGRVFGGADMVVSGLVAGVTALRQDFSTANATATDDKTGLAAETQRLTVQGVPNDLAREIAMLPRLGDVGRLSRLAAQTGRPIHAAAEAYFTVGQHLRLDDLKQLAARVPTLDADDRLAVAQATHQVAKAQTVFARQALASGQPVEAWLQGRADPEAALAKARHVVARVTPGDGGMVTVSRLSVAACQLRDLADAQAQPVA